MRSPNAFRAVGEPQERNLYEYTFVDNCIV